MIEILGSLGGAASLHEEGGKTFIRGNNCPLLAATARCPHACLVAETMIHDLLGVAVKEVCEHGEWPLCCFEFPAANS